MPRASERNEVDATAPLSGGDVEHFETHGYVWLRGGLHPRHAAEWRDRLTRLVRTDPSVIRGLDPPGNEERLAAFDPADPRTWWWREIRACTPGKSPIRERAPRVLAAAAQLLGGEHRIRMQDWSDSVIINLGRCRPWRRRLRALEALVPPRFDSWHTDDPRPGATIDSFRLGLVLFIALSDSPPLGGGTLFSPRSFRQVVRHVRANAEGADLRNAAMRRFGGWFGKQMVARTGDVLLAHPFLLHCRGPNHGLRARYMAPHHVLQKEPMCFARPDGAYSPVERAVVRVR
jgi:hypothetical protein